MYLEKIIFIALLLFYTFRSIGQILTHSVTFDEPFHITSGLEWLESGYSISDPFSPPLSKIPFGILQLFNVGLLNDPYLIIPRLIVVILTSLFLIYFYNWIKSKFNKTVALLSLLFLTIEPTFIAYTHLATTEALTMITFFVLFTKIYDFSFSKSQKNLLPTSISVILLYLTKSVFLPVFIIFLIPFVKKIKSLDKVSIFKQIILSLLIFIIFILMLSGFNSQPAYKGHFSIPGGGIIASTFSAVNYVVDPAFIPTRQIVFMGKVGNESSYFYIPISFILKTSPHLLLLTFISFFYILFSKNKNKIVSYSLLISLSVVVLVSIGNYNTGVRHLLPIFPLIALSSGFAFTYFFSKKINIYKIVILTIVSLSILNSFLTKDTLSYFNPLIGSKNGPEIITESNFEWGQSLPAIKNTGYKIDYLISNTRMDHKFYGIDANPLPSDWEKNIQILKGKNVFISHTQYYKSGFYKKEEFSLNKVIYTAENTYLIFRF